MLTRGADGMNSKPISKYAVIYARSATSQELGASYGLDAQVKACQEYCKQRGYVLRDIYQETASGAEFDRPMLNALRQAMRDHQFDVLIIWDFTRLVRKFVLQAVILRESYEAGVTIESVQNDQYEGDVARFITMAHEYMAEVQIGRIQVRTKKKAAAVRQQKAQQQ
jgi:DNA invertase Pin-like site-specific DNA recombinase